MDKEESFVSKMYSFGFLNEKELFRILFEFYDPLVCVAVRRDKITELCSLKGKRILEIPGLPNAIPDNINNKTYFHKSTYFSDTPGEEYTDSVEVDLWSQSYKDVCPFVPPVVYPKSTVTVTVKAEKFNKGTNVKIANREGKQKSFLFQGKNIPRFETIDFVCFVLKNRTIFLNKHTFQTLELNDRYTTGYICNSPNIFFSFFPEKLIELDKNMNVYSYPFDTRGGFIEGIAFVQ